MSVKSISSSASQVKIVWLLSVLVCCLLSIANAQTDQEKRGNAIYRRIGLMDGNLVKTLFKNYGEVTDYPNEPSANWPSLGRHYCDGVALIVSVSVENSLGEHIHPMETQYREFTDVSPEDIPWGFEPRPYWFNMDTRENKFPAMSNDSISWPETWPDRSSTWDNYWNGYFGKGIFNADLETVFVFDDDPDKEPNLQMNYYCDDNDSTRGGLGLWVKTRGFQWSQVLAEDCIFWLYNITNESTHNYDSTFYSQYIDWGIGGVEDGADDIGMYDTDLDIAYAYDTDGIGTPGNWSPVGYAGYAFLESPGIESDGEDNDHDGIIDEKRYSDGPGQYIDVYPYGFTDEHWSEFEQAYFRSPGPHWSEDEDCDWRPFGDLNDNEIRDDNEQINDDLGADGVGPYDIHYQGPDDGEADGKPTNGEPNYNATDPDESDQIGLTGFKVFATHDHELTDDEENWDVFINGVPPHDQILRPNNLAMFFSSGIFPLVVGQTERYSMALLFGEDLDDLIKNKNTVQQIYNADYRFSKPPLKPSLKVIPGDNKVTLIWDDVAERSFDPFLQEFDFEGYMIYKSTEPQFLESKVITDAYGNKTYRKPVAQYDLQDGKQGPHPVDIYGIKYNLGTDSGLKHTWIDEDVYNGQTYYYTVVSYDYGLVNYGSTGAEGISPSECSSIIKTNSLGDVIFMDINTGTATPRPASAGYQDARILDDIVHIGPGTGSVSVQVVDEYAVPSGQSTYEISFLNIGKFNTYPYPYLLLRDVVNDTLVIDSLLINLENQETPLFYGTVITVDNGYIYNGSTSIDSTVLFDRNASYWLNGSSDYEPKVRMNPDWEFIVERKWNVALPSDFEIRFHDFDSVVTTSFNQFGFFPYPSNIEVYNVTDSMFMDYGILDNDLNQKYSMGDDIALIVPDANFILGSRTSWTINFLSKFETDTIFTDTGFEIDTVWLTVDPPEAGETYLLKTTKPFRSGDLFRFTLQGPDSSNTRAKDELADICVVPNPYVVTAAWEPKSYYQFGRGERRIYFFHLPQNCTIRIYTLRGYLVDTITHNGLASDGMEPWDLLSKDGQDISYGVYIYHVNAPGVGEKTGKFAIIK